MQLPVVHAGSVLPVLNDGALAEGFRELPERSGASRIRQQGYVRPVKVRVAAAELGKRVRMLVNCPRLLGVQERVHNLAHVCFWQALDYDVIWVDLLELDGVAPYTYSEELPYDDLLSQHVSGVLERSEEYPCLVIAALPRADSPSADRYAQASNAQAIYFTPTLSLRSLSLRLAFGAVSPPYSKGRSQRLHAHPISKTQYGIVPPLSPHRPAVLVSLPLSAGATGRNCVDDALA
eukprot:1338926-Pleurochrysis_carterae.AAC.3